MSQSTTDCPVPLVVLTGVNKYRDALHVLQDIDLTIHHGEVVAVIGPRDSGTSTLCRTINRLERIDAGTITVDGRPLPTRGRALDRLRAEIGMVFRGFHLFAHRTVLENVVLPQVTVRRTPRAVAEASARALLERVGVGAHADRYPAGLSGGQQQRVAIARALAMEPRMLLFDQPTSALDPEMTAEVLDVMHTLAAEGRTMVVATHELGFARSAAHRVLFMADGRILEDRTPEAFFSTPRSERAKDFLAAVAHH
ncbi:amino acid ABC transporter ATP-binding protein [Kitasatospora nipponensis]|uniref:Amino acid ABC transporter ATP-binding protein n=1 Tax=Kitasatospora nipponensis TaxID=258049 RepID=A0ABN1WWC0_9ACTN